MKTKYSRILGLFAVMMLVVSFVVPANMVNSSPVNAVSDEDKNTMEWLMVDTPDSLALFVKELYTPREAGSEIIQLLVGNNGATMYTLVRAPLSSTGAARWIELRSSTNGGRSWSGTKWTALDDMVSAGARTTVCWNMAIAPNDPKMIAMACAVRTVGVGITQQVWISTDGGSNWENTQWPPVGGTIVAGVDIISTMDISPEFGNNGAHDLLIGTRDGAGLGTDNIQIMKMPGYGGWNMQNAAGAPPSVNPFTGDVIVAKFSPTYDADSTICVVYSQPLAGAKTGTWFMTGVHDLAVNRTTWQDPGFHVEVKNTSSVPGFSPRVTEIITADLELPSDFSGQSASLRRAYISTDALDRVAGTSPNRGIYSIDDNIVYTLMDNTSTFQTAAVNLPNRRISSIAYWGTYASGKLLAGEVLGYTCQAAVPTWFTDSPTVCPVPCWYPAKKPTSGAAGLIVCNPSTTSWGNAQVAWSPTYADQGVAYVVTGSSNMDAAFNLPVAGDWAVVENIATAGWPSGYLNFIALDESAFGLTRNNGETWNQLSLIDTRMSKLTDVAPSADCTTIYLASTNNATFCKGFDSVWRSSSNEKVVAPPLPALEIGQVWERIRVSPTAISCNMTESQYAILRLAPDKEDGQIVFWAAGGTSGRAFIPNAGVNAVDYPVDVNTRAVAWSPDYGDYWADINPRVTVQDMEPGSSTLLYIVSLTNDVQKMPYLTTAWSSSYNTVSAGSSAHTIEVYAEDNVLIGSGRSAFMTALSTNGGQSFAPATRPPSEGVAQFGYHVQFDTDFADNSIVYVGNDAAAVGRIHRNKLPEKGGSAWEDMVTPNTAHREYYGLRQTNSKNVSNQGTLYAAHDAGAPNAVLYCGVERTLWPLWGIPKPGIFWDCLDAAATFFQIQGTVVEFTLEPKSLKLCGCLTPDTYTQLYAIDNDWYANNHNVQTNHGGVAALADRGMLWRYIDCMAKKGPVLTMDDGEIIGCDPATGRNQEVNFTWEQMCIATDYDMAISKDKSHTLRVASLNNFRPVSTTSPALVYFSNGGATMPATVAVPSLECGHSYYWRVRVRDETTGDFVRSPWSETRSFTIKAGFRVTTPYYGPQLLAPDNGCGCPCDAPLCFSWSPFKETTDYRFQLSENPDMSSPLVNEVVKGSTAYQYTNKAKCNTNYFWRVQAESPAPSEWSAVFSFMTQAELPSPPPPPVTPEEATPLWVWVIIAIGAILVIVTLVLIFKTRRV